MTERLLAIIVPVFAVVALGYAWGRRVRPDMAVVNRLSMNVLAPALIFSALSSKSFDVADNALLMLGSVGVVLGSGLLSWPIARWIREDARTFVPPMMFNNCGNMGLPLAVLAFGEAGFPAMVALFTISNLIQFTLGTWLVDRNARFGSLARNPMVLSTLAGFAFAIFHPPLPEVAAVTIKLVGDALIPMMLLSLGVRLTGIRWADARLGAIGGAVCPLTGLAMAAILAPLLGLDARQAGLLFLFGCLPPAVLNFMVAEQFRREPAKVASMVLIGNLMSVIFVPIGLALA
ncbi:MAG: AEC family transporter, partial [Burkholderiales bacterium]|nr:AEC family transporter [Burkholderiales bacterium]